MAETGKGPGPCFELAPGVPLEGDISSLAPIEALSVLYLHMNSIIGISGDVSYSEFLQRQSLETSDQERPNARRDAALVRNFFSRQIPGISLKDYLLRLHRYCPMSTGVYLATSWFITRMALVEKIVPVTAYNAHRLVLGGLRVATKLLEDLHHSHERFSKVGGVAEAQLTRFEIDFCYLMDFDLKVNYEILSQEITMFQERLDDALSSRQMVVQAP
ncbi:cyclin-dependent protein kinase complex component [Coccidioides immitis RS]|uniref:Cyclin-dependent protein kinase complex component n=3 Tax=Coccidioides immitis TaxID=5501 RepID=A0A0E1RZI8_COCIM|nr:cyclin-dependent protein kinase complex component [Coccidioides immitis RS]EAS35591.1 cyclin-dependent protein kinase complex component [Coccidioides immitis RS]KMP00853.1 hypothetical protein CIRG_00995 [Coccidioides immitis RMSCC 2394]KMU85518.1 hypothetical protein CIHG_03301 [Coccidioides immitis H538.4]TPX26180.1 hypothetical protein DIZ76_011641 [Coccidioides immitis]